MPDSKTSKRIILSRWKIPWVIPHMPSILALPICITCPKLGAEKVRRAAPSAQQRESRAFLSTKLSHTHSEEGSAASPRNYFSLKKNPKPKPKHTHTKNPKHLSSLESPGWVSDAVDTKQRPGWLICRSAR